MIVRDPLTGFLSINFLLGSSKRHEKDALSIVYMNKSLHVFLSVKSTFLS